MHAASSAVGTTETMRPSSTTPRAHASLAGSFAKKRSPSLQTSRTNRVSRNLAGTRRPNRVERADALTLVPRPNDRAPHGLRRGCAFARFAHRTGDWTPQARPEPWTGTRFRSAASILTTRAIALLRAEGRHLDGSRGVRQHGGDAISRWLGRQAQQTQVPVGWFARSASRRSC